MANDGESEKENKSPIFPPAVNPLGIRSVYSNNMEVTFSNFDVRLNFNEIIPEQGSFVVERRASIVTPIPHFKAIVEAFNSSLAQLEDKLKEQKSGTM